MWTKGISALCAAVASIPGTVVLSRTAVLGSSSQASTLAAAAQFRTTSNSPEPTRSSSSDWLTEPRSSSARVGACTAVCMASPEALSTWRPSRPVPPSINILRRLKWGLRSTQSTGSSVHSDQPALEVPRLRDMGRHRVAGRLSAAHEDGHLAAGAVGRGLHHRGKGLLTEVIAA